MSDAAKEFSCEFGLGESGHGWGELGIAHIWPQEHSFSVATANQCHRPVRETD